MKTVPTYESSLRFARNVYGFLALLAFLTHNIWVMLFCAIIMTVGVIYPNKSNGIYQFHRIVLRPLFKDKAKPILRGTGELRFACIFGSIFLVAAFIIIRLGSFVELAWILVLVLSLVMLLSGFSGICAATLLYIFFIKKFLLRWRKEEEEIILPEVELGDPNYVNPDCVVSRAINAPPFERCQYCRMKYFKECPTFRFIIFTSCLMILCLGIIFLIEKTFFWYAYKVIIFSVSFFAIAYGYLFNKTTIKIIKAEREFRKELEKKAKELEKFYDLTVGRELKMIELKKEIKELEKKLEKE